MQILRAASAMVLLAQLLVSVAFGATQDSAVAHVKAFVEPTPRHDAARSDPAPLLCVRPGEAAVWARSLSTEGWSKNGELQMLKSQKTPEGRIELHGGVRDDGDARVVRLYLISWPE